MFLLYKKESFESAPSFLSRQKLYFISNERDDTKNIR